MSETTAQIIERVGLIPVLRAKNAEQAHAVVEAMIAGGKLYLNDCMGCHGAPGKAPSDFGATFYPPAPQLARDGTLYSEAQIFWVAKHGIRRTGMSAQRSSYSDQQLWSLAAFISHITNLRKLSKNCIGQGRGP